MKTNNLWRGLVAWGLWDNQMLVRNNHICWQQERARRSCGGSKIANLAHLENTCRLNIIMLVALFKCNVVVHYAMFCTVVSSTLKLQRECSVAHQDVPERLRKLHEPRARNGARRPINSKLPTLDKQLL